MGYGLWALVLRTLIVLAAVLIALKLVVSYIEPALVFYPVRGEDETPARFGIRYTALKLRTSDGVEIAAWQLEPGRPSADIVYFHGNGGNLSMWLPVLAALHTFGYRVLAIDYRGYGVSGGTPSEAGLYKDAEAAVRHAAATRGDATWPLVFWGRSLGGSVAAAAARIVTPDALILESAFPEKGAVIRNNPVLLAANVFSSYRFDTLQRLQGFDRPVLVVHGDRDTIIPYSLGKELFERLRSPKRFVTVKGADHNDVFAVSHEAYWRPIREFIEKPGL